MTARLEELKVMAQDPAEHAGKWCKDLSIHLGASCTDAGAAQVQDDEAWLAIAQRRMVRGVCSAAFGALKHIFLSPCMGAEWAGASKQHAGKYDESCWAQLPCGRKRGRHRGTTAVLLKPNISRNRRH
jgi:hypothetical protein